MAGREADDPGRAAAPGRSEFVTVLAWIFIIISGFAVLVSIFQNVMVSFFPVERITEAMRDEQAQQHMPAAFRFLFEHFVLFVRAFLVITLALLAASIGLIRRRNWARLLFIALLVLGILWNLGGLAMQFLLVPSFPPLPQEAPAEMDAMFGRMLLIVRVLSALFAVAFTILCGWIIRKLTSERVRAEFET